MVPGNKVASDHWPAVVLSKDGQRKYLNYRSLLIPEGSKLKKLSPKKPMRSGGLKERAKNL